MKFDGASSFGSLANPQRVICVGKGKYWLKEKAQHGLASELIGARLAAKVHAGPGGAIIHVSDWLATSNPDLAGLVFGSEHVDGTENSKHLGALMGASGGFDPGRINARSRAAATVFDSWIGKQGDLQVLVRLTDGMIYSIDHGHCFGSPTTSDVPQVALSPLPGVPNDLGRDVALIEEAVSSIESLQTTDLLEVVSCIPNEPRWGGATDHRIQIVGWLAYRRDHLREVLIPWAQS